jgi:hypothetical protein
MIADVTFSNFTHQETVAALRSAGEEFDSALRRDELTDDLALKYHSALKAYEIELRDSLYAAPPSDPSAYDSMMHERMMGELARVNSEISRILDRVGSLVHDPEEDSE